MKRKGFTLIELLAVIVILAIIALITTPIIIGVIDKARRGAFLDSAYGVLDTLKLEYIEKAALNDTKNEVNYEFPNSGLKLSGTEPGGGSAMIDKDGKVELAIYDKDRKWCATKADNEETITLVDYIEGSCKITLPILNKNFLYYNGTGVDIYNITSIEIVPSKEVPEDALKSWDASEAKNGSVMAWAYEDQADPTKYNLYIGGNKRVYAPENSSGLFAARNPGTKVSYIKTMNLTYLNTSKVTNMSFMFQNDHALRNLDISHFDTSKVTNMSFMFDYCYNLDQLSVSGFDTSSVENMENMFKDTRRLYNLDISSFSFENVIKKGSMFFQMDERTIIKVKDTEAQNWILSLTGSDRPAEWTTSNIIVG